MKPIPQIIAWLLAAIFLVTLATIALFGSFGRIEETVLLRKQTYAVLSSANAFLSTLKEAETGQREYLLIGDEALLVPYLALNKGLSKHLEKLRYLATGVNTAHQHLDTLIPLVNAKLTLMANDIEVRRKQNRAAAMTVVSDGEGKLLMDSIRTEMNYFIQAEESVLALREAALKSSMRQMLITLVFASLLTLSLSLAFAYLIYRHAQQRIKNTVLLETQHLLEQQEETNTQLQQANFALLEKEEKLSVTLNSIGDAVLATDVHGRITQLNPIAEQLTGWAQAEANGRLVGEVFSIINKETRLPAVIPVLETLAHGTVQGLANHAVLIARDGKEWDIADSCAPIRDRSHQVVGAVLVFRNVTKEYAIQQALRDSAARVQTLLNTVADGIVTLQAESSLIETVTPVAERMFGYSAAELVGEKFSLLIPELDRDPGNASFEYYSASDEARASGLGREVMGRRKDGHVFPLEIAVSEMWLGGKRYFTSVLRDISLRKQAEEALVKAGALQSAIFNSANFSSIATDAQGVIQIFNVGAERMLGYAAADVMNKITPAEISDPHEVIERAKTLSIELETPIEPGFEALAFKASRGIEDIYELTYIRKDGSRFPAVVSVTALRDAQNVIIGYLLIGTDNTVRKQIEAERARLDQVLLDKNAELEIAKSLAEKANLAKSDFLSSMSHELRTPLGAILGFAQLIESGMPPLSATQKRSIEQILKAGWYLLELINEILDLALIESGKVTLSREPVSLGNVLLECRAMIEPQAEKRGIGMLFPHLAPPLFIEADRTRLKQVLINLLFNAVKYNKPGGLVTVKLTIRPSNLIRIGVQDTGDGMSPEQLAQLFQPFNRLGKEYGVEEGTGIGLIVAKQLIELMSGRIGVESEVGVGSMFWIEMSLTSAPQFSLDDDEHETQKQLPLPENAPRHTLLYVEDNPANLELVEQIIARRPDLTLLSAADGNTGIEFARVYLPEVILMDINLPGISGIDAMKILHANPLTSHIPIIALSANAIPRDIEKGLEAGFFRYLTKPIKVNEFMATLDIALQFAKTKAAPTANKEIA